MCTDCAGVHAADGDMVGIRRLSDSCGVCDGDSTSCDTGT